MSYWRFGASIIAAFFGDIFVVLCSIANQIKETNGVLAAVIAALGYTGVIGGFLYIPCFVFSR